MTDQLLPPEVHPCCERCWIDIGGPQFPNRMTNLTLGNKGEEGQDVDGVEEDFALTCCVCGYPTWARIFITADNTGESCKHDQVVLRGTEDVTTE